MGPLEYKEEGNRHFRDRRWREAIEQYTLGLQGRGENGSAELAADTRGLLLSNRSQCWLNLEEWQRALEDADACLQLLPEHAKSLFRRAGAHERLGHKEEAFADYARVARAEPQNAVAADAAKRLREDLLRVGQRRRDEVLPTNLLDMLRDEGAGSTVEQQVDACGKLSALCVHKGLASSLLSAGAVELLVKRAAAEETPQELRQALLAALITIAAGHEAGDDEGDSGRAPPQATGPLPVPAAASEARVRLRRLLPLSDLRRLCRAHVGATRQFAILLGLTHEPEDTEALEALHDAIAFQEGLEINVPRAGITALTAMCDTRRRLGSKGKPLMATATVLKCLESSLGTTSCAEALRGLLAVVFTLLGDGDDRPKDAQVDLAAVGSRVLEPFLQSEDFALKANGLAGLSALLAVNVKVATQLLRQSPVPLMAILAAVSRPPPGPEGSAAKDHAAECMLLAVGDQKTRAHLIEGEGIEILLGNLGDGEEGSAGLIRAKLIAVLAITAGHNKEVREEIFDRIDFLMELRHALDQARESARAARAGGAGAPSVEEARRLCRGLYESCTCLTIHGEFKELLFGAKKTLKAMLDLVGVESLAEDPQLAFLYSSIVYNLCRSRDDKVRPKKNEFPFNELDEDDLNAVEEFYDKLPAESRPVKNGEVDPGSRELAEKLRAWCVQPGGDAAQRPGSGGGAPPENPSAIAHLARCAAHGSPRVKALVAMVFKLLCAAQVNRRFVVMGGGIRALLGLVDLEEESARDAARQALAQVLITTNPALLQYSEQLDSVRPLVQLLEHRHELLQFEGAMGLTNLLTVSDELRTRAVQGDAWRACRDLLFSDNEQVQRAGLEAMCNLTMAPEVVERFATGKADLEIRVFAGFCHADDRGARVAAAGALAMLAAYEEVAAAIASSEGFGSLLEAVGEATDPDVQHRVVSAICSVCEASGAPQEAVAKARAALRDRRRKGFVSCEAEGLIRAVLDEGAVVGGA